MIIHFSYFSFSFIIVLIFKIDLEEAGDSERRKPPVTKRKATNTKSSGKSKKKSSKKGGGSDWSVVQYARGPSNTTNMSSCGCASKVMKNFTKAPEAYVPNTKLGSWVAPQLTGTTDKMC